MEKISCHSSGVIIEAEKTGELLLGRYDETYPTKFFRGAVNLIGGNYEKSDKSPLEILLREIKQEFSSNQEYVNHREENLRDFIGDWRAAKKIELFASEEDIFLIKREIISNISPYKDFLWAFPSIEGRDKFDSLTSVFISKIAQDVFELARENLKESRSIKNEGSAVICTFKELKQGRLLCAWATPFILSDYKNVEIPNNYNVKAKSIGKPRNSILEYAREFDYRLPI